MSPVINELYQVLETLGESSQFCTQGSLPPVLPGLEVEGIGNIGVPVSASDARRLIERSSQAPYGRGEETIVDTNVRRVWQLEPRQFSLRNDAWGDFVEGIVTAVGQEFGIQEKIRHELYKLLVYEEGSFFAPHRDTEKIPGMFATLVVCLPSSHEGGTLVVTHDGETKRIDFSGAGSEFDVRYAAFYADCQHEITPVTSGYRVCLIYNLAIAGQKEQPSAPENAQAVDAVAELLPKLLADDEPDKIIIPFKHQYSKAELDPRKLKGADRSRLAVLTRAAERVGLQAFIALLTHYQSGSPDYNTIRISRPRRRYRRFDGGFDDDVSGENEGAEFEQVDEEIRSLGCWLDPQGRKYQFGRIRFEEDELISADEETKLPYTQQIREATGNEGASMERWYRQAVVVIWPRKRYFRILAREGPEHAVPALEDLVASSPEPREDSDCLAFATEIINHWRDVKRRRSWSYQSAFEDWSDEDDVPAAKRKTSEPQRPSLSGRMLTMLDRIGAVDLTVRFILDYMSTAYDGSEGPILSQLGSQFGWEVIAEPLQRFFAKQMPIDYSSKLSSPVKIFEGLCCSPPAMTDDRRSVCGGLADEVERMIARWDSHQDSKWYDPEPRTGIVESIFLAHAAVEAFDKLSRFVAYVIAEPRRYDLRTVLVPAVKAMHSTLDAGSPARDSFVQLRNHCLAELRSLTATPIEPPANWAREVKLDCDCADCTELVRFMRDPVAKVHRFARRKELRQHLHHRIDSHQLDVTHATERTGSPQTLVCTKNQATYERRLAQFQVDVELLKELGVLSETKANRVDAPSTPRPTKRKRSSAEDASSKKRT